MFPMAPSSPDFKRSTRHLGIQQVHQYEISSKQSINVNPVLLAAFEGSIRRLFQTMTREAGYSGEPKVRGVFQGLASALPPRKGGTARGLPICNGPESRAGLICFKPPPSRSEN